MALKNTIIHLSKKGNTIPTYKGFTKASITFGNRSNKMMIKSMARATASITLKQKVVDLTFQSCKNQNFGSNLHANRTYQNACLLNLKLKSLGIFSMRKILPCGLDKIQAYSNLCSILLVRIMMTMVVAIICRYLQGIHFSHKLKLIPLALLSYQS